MTTVSIEMDRLFDLDDPVSIIEAGLRVADDAGEREALALCDLIRKHAFDIDADHRNADVLLAEAMIYERMGKSMSRDLHAVEAAEAFAFQGEHGLARIALDMVGA